MKHHKTDKARIEILSDRVKIVNTREDNKIYEFDLLEFTQLLKFGGKKCSISNKGKGNTILTFITMNKHLSSAGGGINTFFLHIYDDLMISLEEAEESFIEDMSQEEHDLLYGDWLDD